MKYPYYQNERCGLLLPFLAGALVSAPIAYLAGNNDTPEYVFPPQYQQPPYYVQPYSYQTQPYAYQGPQYQAMQYQYPPQINQNFYPQIQQNPL